MGNNGRVRARAATTIIAVLVFGACGNGSNPTTDDTAPSSIAPPSTVTPAPAPTTAPAVTEPEPTLATPTSTSVATIADGSSLEKWRDQQLAAGRTNAEVYASPGTTARTIVARDPVDPFQFVAAVLLDDRVVEFPSVASEMGSDPRLFGLGGNVVLVALVDRVLTMWVLDPETGGWDDGRTIHETPIDNQSYPLYALIGDSLLIGIDDWIDPGDGVAIPGPDRYGLKVAADLTVSPIAPPPDGVPLTWTVTTDRLALLLGIDANAEANIPLRQPWQYDIVDDRWSEVPVPSWLDCPEEGCYWSAPHEFGDVHLEVSLGSDVVKRLPDGSLAIYSPAEATWRPVDDAPIRLSSPGGWLVAERYVVVAPVSLGLDDTGFGDLAALDVTTGTWTTFAADVAVDPEGGVRRMGRARHRHARPARPAELPAPGPAGRGIRRRHRRVSRACGRRRRRVGAPGGRSRHRRSGDDSLARGVLQVWSDNDL